MLPMFLVDAFALGPFTGNPAAVCLLESWPSDRWLASVAAEMHQAETAFLVPSGGQFELRWFTPAVEVDLCGHATLASAAVLWHVGRVDRGRDVVFSTRSGTLTAAQDADGIRLDFPVTPPVPAAAPDGLLESLSVNPSYVGKSAWDYLLAVDSEATLRAIKPDFRRLSAVDCRGVIVTAASSHAQFDFVSRFFAPASGVDEDQATGSAHCALAAYWSERLGKTDFRAFQASARGAVLGVSLRGDRVHLRGAATIVLEGTLSADAGPE